MTTTKTVRLHRVIAAKPEKVYRAFIEPDALARWLPPNEFTAQVHHMDARIGGTYKMSFTNFTTASTFRPMANSASWCHTSSYAIRTTSTIRTRRERFK